MRDKIQNFWQENVEQLHEAWLILKKKYVHCPNHEFLNKMLLKIFYWSLDQFNKIVDENIAGGSFINEIFGITMRLLDQMMKKAEHGIQTMQI